MAGQGHDHPDSEPAAKPEGDAAATEDEHTHEGSFATGQEETEHHPERSAERDDFAEGQEGHKHTHEGSFAEGQEDHTHTHTHEGSFADGQEERTHTHTHTHEGNIAEGQEEDHPA